MYITGAVTSYCTDFPYLTLIEFDMSDDIDDASNIYFEDIPCEAYDHQYLQVYSDSDISDTLDDAVFWFKLAEEFNKNNIYAAYWELRDEAARVYRDEPMNKEFQYRIEGVPEPDVWVTCEGLID